MLESETNQAHAAEVCWLEEMSATFLSIVRVEPAACHTVQTHPHCPRTQPPAVDLLQTRTCVDSLKLYQRCHMCNAQLDGPQAFVAAYRPTVRFGSRNQEQIETTYKTQHSHQHRRDILEAATDIPRDADKRSEPEPQPKVDQGLRFEKAAQNHERSTRLVTGPWCKTQRRLAVKGTHGRSLPSYPRHGVQ